MNIQKLINKDCVIEAMRENLSAKGVTGISENDGLMDLAGMILDIPDKTYIITQLEINPCSLVYSNVRQVLGTLKDINGFPLANKPIKLMENDVYLTTRNTDKNGVAMFNLRDDEVASTYKQLIFEGDSTYSGSMSIKAL